MSLYGLFMPLSVIIAITIMAYIVFGVTPPELLDLVQTVRAANS